MTDLCQTVLAFVGPKKKYELFLYTFNQKILKDLSDILSVRRCLGYTVSPDTGMSIFFFF